MSLYIKYKCEDCETEEAIEKSVLFNNNNKPICGTCGAFLVPDAISSNENSSNTSTVNDNAIQHTVDLIGIDLREMIDEIMQQSAPSRQISVSYLKTLGKVSIEKSRAIMRDSFVTMGPLKVLAVPASFCSLKSESIDISGPLVVGDPIDGSSALRNASDCNGSIVILRRGVVSFATKSKRALEAGASAVIIIQTVDIWPFLMTDNTGEFGNSCESDVEVPIVMIGKSDASVIMRMLNDSPSDNCSLRVGSFTQECSICQESFLEGETVLKLPCRHLYHAACVTSWLEKNSTCPLCRLQLPKVTAEEKETIDRTRSRNFLNSATSTYYN